MTPEDLASMDDVEAEVNGTFAELLEQHGYVAVVAGTALALAGLALDLPPDEDITEDEQAALTLLFEQVSAPIKAVINARLKSMGVQGAVAAH